MQENIVSDWLSRRKISESTQKDFNLHFGEHITLGPCIVIPVLDINGNFSFNKYRRNPISSDTPKYLYDKGAKILMYGAHKAKTEKKILVTEGEMDALVAWSSNIPAVTGTGGAMSFPIEWSEFFKDKEVTLCFDNDEAGGAGMAKVFDIIPWAKILFLPDRPGIKDISDYVQNGGDLKTLLETATSFKTIEDIIQNRAERISLWKSTHFHDAYIKNHTKPTYVKHERRDTDRMARAKSYPITDLLNFNKNKTSCIFHKERTASLNYYPDSNRVYCFGCGKNGDAIDVYQQLYNCSFKEAVEKLQ